MQFMPQREDIASGLTQEEGENTSALWAVLDDVRENDFLVIQAYGDQHSGCLGEMLVTSFGGRGGVGVLVDGYIRDWPRLQKMDTPIWALGATPNFASQGPLYPWAHAVPVAVGGVLVMPGDIIIADDDGAVVVPLNIAMLVLEAAEKYNIDLKNSYMIGDRWRDIEAGISAECKTIFIDYSYKEKQPVTYDYKVSDLLEAAEYILGNI
jgi:regulator of RNase E activity RraA